MNKFWSTNMKTLIQTAVATLFAASTAQAQQAVQWRAEDGGNGHWYLRTAQSSSWTEASQSAVNSGAHLATITSGGENDFVKSIDDGRFSWLGGRQNRRAIDYVEPGGGWEWVTGEAWEYSDWMAPQQPDNWADREDFLQLSNNGYGVRWNDNRADIEFPAIVEWSADCNGDGIVDYGQCQDGTLPDYNGNNIPDCCEAGTPCTTNLIVNGSFELGVVQPCGWICIGVGDSRLEGWEVTLNSVDRERTEPGGCNENWFASHGNYSVDMNGCSVGGVIRQHVATEVGRRYLLSFDMSLNPTIVSVGLLRVRAGPISQDFEYLRKPTNPQPNERREMAFVASSVLTTIEFESLNREYPAQWNGPVVDSVRLAPSDPALPTCVDADFFRDFTVNGADLGILLSQWGPNTPLTGSDLNADGVVNGADLGILLSFWGACP